MPSVHPLNRLCRRRCPRSLTALSRAVRGLGRWAYDIMWVCPLSSTKHTNGASPTHPQATELNGEWRIRSDGGEDGGFDAHSASGSYLRAFSCKNHRDLKGESCACALLLIMYVALSVCNQLVGVPMADLILCVLCRRRCNVVGAEA